MLAAVKEQRGAQVSGAGGRGTRGERGGQADRWGEEGRLRRDLWAFT